MPLVNNTNVSALQAQRTLGIHTSSVQKSMERLASGFRINRSADDAAGLAISNNMVGQQTRMKQALRNAQDGVSMLQVAEGGISTIGDILQRMRELTVQAANDTNSTASRDVIRQEIDALWEETNRIAESTEFNGITLLHPPGLRYMPIQIGPNSTAQTNVMDIGPALIDACPDGDHLFLPHPPVFNNASAQAYLVELDDALTAVNSQRATMGSFQNQLESVINNLEIGVENFGASVSRIRDLDIAEESSQLVQSQILQQSAVQVLAQSNKLPQMILGLLDH